MSTSEVILIGLKRRVAAIARGNGKILWSTELSGGMTADFVTLVCDGTTVFAYTGGHLHGLDFTTGRILWVNELPGFGYGVGSLCLPDGASAPEPPIVHQILTAQRSRHQGDGAN